MNSKTMAIPIGVALTILTSASLAYAEHPGESIMTSTVHDAPATTHAATFSVEADCVISAHLMLGNAGIDVACLQRELIESGYLQIAAPTGYFGSMTKSALTKWQKEHGVATTGYFGTLSRAAFGHQENMSTTMPAAHPHAALDASTWPAVPSVTIQVHKDTMSGYNLEITPVNFRFAPEHVNGVVLQNEGHTHLYINGKKITRVYGPWLHMAPELFVAGQNEVLVTLNANDHSDIAIGGVRIEAKTIVTK